MSKAARAAAHRAGQNARLNQYEERSNHGNQNYSAGKYDFDSGVCFWCLRKKGRMHTGYMAISGPVWYCPKHKSNYEKDKQWEEERK